MFGSQLWCAFAVGLPAAVASLNQSSLHDVGYWVVAGSMDAGAVGVEQSVDSRREDVAKCGFVAFGDLSSKFTNFEPGYIVVVVGPFRVETTARAVSDRIRVCVPDVYVKFSVY